MDEFCDEKVISKIKDIISAHLRNDGWAELARVGAALNLNGINLKEKGYKVKSFSTCTGGYDRILSCKLNADSAIP